MATYDFRLIQGSAIVVATKHGYKYVMAPPNVSDEEMRDAAKELVHGNLGKNDEVFQYHGWFVDDANSNGDLYFLENENGEPVTPTSPAAAHQYFKDFLIGAEKDGYKLSRYNQGIIRNSSL